MLTFIGMEIWDIEVLYHCLNKPNGAMSSNIRLGAVYLFTRAVTATYNNDITK